MKPSAAVLEVDLDLLEPVLRGLVRNEKIGMAATMLLVDRYGGLPLYVPQAPGPGHHISLLIGHRAATALAAVFPGESITLPKAGAALRDVRNRRMREARGGASIRQLAQGFQLGRRRVQQILAEDASETTAEQPGLFE